VCYGTSTNIRTGEPRIRRVVCTMTKAGDEIVFDMEGTSEQSEDANNMTLVGSWGQLFVALSSQLFWNIPWNGGMAKPVTMKIPEGTFLNCRYPAACGNAPSVGSGLTSAAGQCIAKMLFAAGLDEDVNASGYGAGAVGGASNTGGPGFFYGGHNQHGLPVGQGLYDMHGSGFGAAPYRDGVSTGGHTNNPSVGISDIENIELQYPLVYFSRNHMLDSGGFGAFRGGLGMQRIIMVYGTSDLTVNYSPYHGIPGGWGLFGGYPAGVGGSKFVVEPERLAERMAASRFPLAFAEIAEWGKVHAPKLPPLSRLKIPEGALIADPVEVGSGYGDPLDRDPALVLADVINYAVSPRLAADVYGVAIAAGPAVDAEETARLRAAMKAARLEGARTGRVPACAASTNTSSSRAWVTARPPFAVRNAITCTVRRARTTSSAQRARSGRPTAGSGSRCPTARRSWANCTSTSVRDVRPSSTSRCTVPRPRRRPNPFGTSVSPRPRSVAHRSRRVRP
jgi:N-methylhydantoinase B